MGQESMIIAFASDDKYASYTGVAIQSLCEHISVKVRIVMLSDCISVDKQKKIESIISKFSNASLEWIDVDVKKYFSHSVLIRDITLSAYSRFLLPKFFPKEKRLVYVDGDVVFLKDASKIVFELDNDHIIAAAIAPQNEYIKSLCRRLNLSVSHKWFYDGCLVINCDEWNKNNIFSKLMEAEKKYYNDIAFGDQDLLNIVFDNDYSPLDEIYSATNNEITEELHKKAIIRHFEGGVKPWKQHPLKIWAKRYKAKYKGLWEFWKVAIRSPFKEELFAKYSVERWIMEQFMIHS